MDERQAAGLIKMALEHLVESGEVFGDIDARINEDDTITLKLETGDTFKVSLTQEV